MLVALFLVFLLSSLVSGGNRPQISYTTFRQQVIAGNVTQVVVSGEKIQGSFKKPYTQSVNGQSRQLSSFTTYLPSFGDTQLMSLLEQHGVKIVTRPARSFSWLRLFITFLPILLLVGLGFLFVRRMRSQGGMFQDGGIFSAGRSRAKRYSHARVKTTFDDVAGTEGAKRELAEVVEFLKSPQRFLRLGSKIPKGVLLAGPPGTGKTLLARAVAGEAGVPFFSTNGSDFMEIFVGVGASRVRNMFEEAKKVAPAILFIDELDSLGRRRGAGSGGGNDEREQTLNQLLSEMDGFEPNKNVIIIAATNRPDVLDPALLRPGRFDRQVTVNLPNTQSRLAILHIHARDKPLAEDTDLARFAKSTVGLSGADLANLLNEAALVAAQDQERTTISWEDIAQARDRVLLGRKREGLELTDEDKRLIAYHEGGHALLAVCLPHADPLDEVTIVPRGRAMGVTQQLPEHERHLYRRAYLEDRLTVMMGGRAAEAIALEETSSGAASDLKEATRLAHKMVVELGMSEKLGPVSYSEQPTQAFLGEELLRRREYGEAVAEAIDAEVRTFTEAAYARAVSILTAHRASLDRLAEALIEHEELSGEEVRELLEAPKLEQRV